MVARSPRARVRTLGTAGALAGAGLTLGLTVVAAQTAPGRPAASTPADRTGATDASQVLLLRPPDAPPAPASAPAAATTGGS